MIQESLYRVVRYWPRYGYHPPSKLDPSHAALLYFLMCCWSIFFVKCSIGYLKTCQCPDSNKCNWHEESHRYKTHEKTYNLSVIRRKELCKRILTWSKVLISFKQGTINEDNAAIVCPGMSIEIPFHISMEDLVVIHLVLDRVWFRGAWTRSCRVQKGEALSR